MSGGTSTLWRTSLCGVALALTVLSTGCAMQNVDADDADEETVETQAGVTIALPQPKGGLQAPKNPLGAPRITKGGTETESPGAKLNEVSDPLPEPWHPDARGGDDDPDDVKLSTTPDRSDDYK